jgi:DNA-directed RNA polymerase subunit beta
MPKTTKQSLSLATPVVTGANRPQKTFSKYRTPLVTVPDLVEPQRASYKEFLETGLVRAIKEFSPIPDYSGKKFELRIVSLSLHEAEHDEFFAKENKLTYEGTLKARVILKNLVLGTEKEQEIFFTEVPLMTPRGTFIINGVERVLVPQIGRSYGVFFEDNIGRKGRFFGAKIMPARGAWIDIESEHDNAIYVRIDKKRKFPVSMLFKAFGVEKPEAILKLFKNETAIEWMKGTLGKDHAETKEDAAIEVYRRLRDGEVASPENALEFFQSIFSPDRYDLSTVGRFNLNSLFGWDTSDKALSEGTLSLKDFVAVIERISELNSNPKAKPDDVDHLGRRRVRYVGEMLEQRVRKGMMQMKRNIQDKMSTIDSDTSLPIQIINQRPLQVRIKEFFSQNQLSQFFDQQNILSELEHLRILSALGQGGLTRERAGFEVRDVHTSHYGRVCPVHTPEGPNIGLISHQALFARTNRFGMLETPYVKVEKGKMTGEIVYLNAMQEEECVIAHAGNKYDKDGNLEGTYIEARIHAEPGIAHKKDVQYIDVATYQGYSVASSLIPFLEHDDAKRTLMGSNMQKQAAPCIVPMAPLVATGIESAVAENTRRMVTAIEAGTVSHVDGRQVEVKNSSGKTKVYPLTNFARTNQYTVFHHRPAVSVGDKVKKGDILADTSTTDGGQLAIGQNVLVAFMCWNGANFEDAIIVSERLVKNSIFTSIHIDEYECVVRDTKLGEEVTTHDIPNVSETRLRNLDEDGIVRIGAEVRENDILVGKITPKGETELTPEERLLRSLFGEKARDVKDTSLRVEHGKVGRVIGVKVFSRELGHELESGVLKKIYIEVAQLRNVQVGDKLAGRHGNKGVISTVLREEDMPFMADGTPVDVILTPLGVPSRMNLGQILEMHLGLAANSLGYQAIVPPFGGATPDEIKEELDKAGFAKTGKVQLFDGRTGEAFEQEVAVGYMYILKLMHMVEDKMHARAVGPYSLITQQPLGGKSQFGGQRFGEMEVWALEGYGAAYTLREMLTVKSDDIMGRTETFDALIKGRNVPTPHQPASFKVMINYLKGLGLDVNLEGVQKNYQETYEETSSNPLGESNQVI